MRWDSSFPLYVAVRYLKSTRRDAFIRFLSAVTAAGLILGVAALVLALAALSGFQSTLKGEILARTPEIEVELPAEADDVAGISLRLQELRGIESVQPLIRGRGWLLAGGRVRPVELVGYEGRLPAFFPESSDRAPGTYISSGLATVWGLEAGDLIEVLSTRPTLTPFGPQPRVRRLTLAGSFASGRTEHQERVALPLSEAAALLGLAERRLLLSTGDLDLALALAPEVAARLPEGSVIRTWSDLNKALLFALRLEKGLMFVAVFLIVVVAAMSLVADLTLILASKRPEVGMMGAMGADPPSLQRIFLWLGPAGRPRRHRWRPSGQRRRLVARPLSPSRPAGAGLFSRLCPLPRAASRRPVDPGRNLCIDSLEHPLCGPPGGDAGTGRGPPPMSVAVEAQGLFKAYRDGARLVEVLRGVDLRVSPGEFVAVVGPSGSGKSTLLHLLGALDRPDSGSVEIGGESLAGLDRRELAAFRNRTIGFVFQFQELLADFTALENVLLPARIAGSGGRPMQSRARNLLAEVGLGSRLDHLPSELSGGERQRVALCRALVLEPPLLLADEPTGNLDPDSGERVFGLMLDLQRRHGTTALVVTHNPDLAKRCGRLLALENGILRPPSV